MPDTVFTIQHRPRWWRWLWRAIGLMGLAGAAAACIWLFVIVKQQSGQPGPAGPFLAVGGFVAAILQVMLAWLQLRQGGGAKSVEPLAAHERREGDARDRLRVHLGRQGRLRRMDDPATRALALRVHPAIDLLQPAACGAAASLAARSQPTGWRRLLLRPRHGGPNGALALDPDLPTFVDRDKSPDIRDWMRQARETGGFLLLVGDSCVGKTRLLYEAAREVLGDFEVLVPDLGGGDLINGIAEATFRLPRLIVWLDELQRFLDGPYLTSGSTPITATTVRHLLDATTPVIIVGTLWPEYVTRLRATEPDQQQPTQHDRQQPRYPKAFDILVDRRLHEITLHTFSAEERRAADRLKSEDPRLAKALADPDYNVTEVLAGARELVRRYEQATEEQQAILHAAIDARRLGIQAPLTEQLLAAAAQGYLTTVHPDNTWFPTTLTELIIKERPQDRATAPLIPEVDPDGDKRTVLGYTVADYLLQRLTRHRRSTRLSAVTWRALIDHIGDTDDADDRIRLTLSADHRLLYCYAEPLYRHFAHAGDTYAAGRLVDLLVNRKGPADEMAAVFQILIDAGASYGGKGGYVVARLDKQGRREVVMAVLQAWTDAGDKRAAEKWAELLIEQDRTDQAVPIARILVDIGRDYHAERYAAWWYRLIEQDRTDEAMTVLRAFTDAGGKDAANQLANELAEHFRTHVVKSFKSLFGRSEEHIVEGWFDRLIEQERTDEATTVLRALVDAGGWRAADLLADVLAKQRNIEELRTRADADKKLDLIFRKFDPRLADLLAEHGDIDELRARADTGSSPAAFRLADLLVDHGDIEELRARADTGDEAAGTRLADLLIDRGDIEGLIARADTGDKYAAEKWAELLINQDRIDEAIPIMRTLADSTGWHADWLVSLLREQGNFEEAITLLRAQADTGDRWAAADWAKLLIEQDRTDQAISIVKALVDTNQQYILNKWRNRLAEQGRTDQALTVLRALADTGDNLAADRLVETLLAQNRTEDAIDVLRARADGDTTGNVTYRLAQLLVQQDHLDELQDRADAGDINAAGRLADLLEEQGCIEELRHRAAIHEWDWCAKGSLVTLLVKQGRIDELQHRADAGQDYAAIRLADLLAKQGHIDQLRDRADAGDSRAAERLTDLLAQNGRIDDLWHEVYAGTPDAGKHLIDLLDRVGETERAERIRSFGLNPDGSIAEGDPYKSSAVEQEPG